MKLSEARSNCTIPCRLCSIQTQKAEGEVTKALLCMDLMCHKMLRQAHAESQTRHIERFSYATPGSNSWNSPSLLKTSGHRTHIFTRPCQLFLLLRLWIRVIAKLFQFSISRSKCLSSSLPATETVRHRARAATSLSDQLPPRNRWHLVILSLSSFSELSESSLGNPRNSREKFWRSNGSTVLMMIINDSGSNSMSLWSEKFFLWRILKASWKEQSLTWKLKHKGPFELGQIHPHLVKCWSYILDMMVLFGFSSNGSSSDVFHISTLIPYDSIRDTPSCHHPLCHPPPLPPLKESIVIFILPKNVSKSPIFLHVLHKKKTDINKL